jgi:glycine betaine/proline transport system substrate-binding protein
MNGMLVYMADQQASGKDAAYAFLEKHGNVWEKWVSADVAKKIKSSL